MCVCVSTRGHKFCVWVHLRIERVKQAEQQRLLKSSGTPSCPNVKPGLTPWAVYMKQKQTAAD